MGLDPGIRTGVKVAVVDQTGKLLGTSTVYPHEPRNDWAGSLAALGALCIRHKVEVIAIGNGTASRETDKLASELIKKLPDAAITKVMVSEAGASVYSASELAAAEFPDLDVSLEPAPTVIIVGLPTGLRLAVDNAIANAVKHGGATHVQLSAVSSRNGVEIAVDDNGVGVPEEERIVVFDRFARGSTASRSGSGLGLALVAQQAELHGGTAVLEQSPLGGARLMLALPGPS